MMTNLAEPRKCQRCFRVTDHRCDNCYQATCPIHLWTHVMRKKAMINGVVGHHDEYRGIDIMTEDTKRYELSEQCRGCAGTQW